MSPFYILYISALYFFSSSFCFFITLFFYVPYILSITFIYLSFLLLSPFSVSLLCIYNTFYLSYIYQLSASSVSSLSLFSICSFFISSLSLLYILSISAIYLPVFCIFPSVFFIHLSYLLSLYLLWKAGETNFHQL